MSDMTRFGNQMRKVAPMGGGAAGEVGMADIAGAVGKKAIPGAAWLALLEQLFSHVPGNEGEDAELFGPQQKQTARPFVGPQQLVGPPESLSASLPKSGPYMEELKALGTSLEAPPSIEAQRAMVPRASELLGTNPKPKPQNTDQMRRIYKELQDAHDAVEKKRLEKESETQRYQQESQDYYKKLFKSRR